MRLLSATVRNYRIHRDKTIEFDPSRNLIGGTNETGKSTLAEAIHRALFFRHRSGGEVQRAMKSDIHNGHPEVTLVFEANGQTWTLDKRFSGTSGTARLMSDGGSSFQGDEAEEKLAQLTGNTEGTAATSNQLNTRWAHLWVWQGKAGEDATTHTAAHRDELVQRLQDQGLAAVMQSDADERAREKIRISHDEIFTGGGKVKSGTRLDLAAKELLAAEQTLAAATAQKQRLETAITELETATKNLAESESVLPAKRVELEGTRTKLKEADDLQSRLERETQTLQLAANSREQLAKTDAQIHGYLAQAASTKATLAPAELELKALAEQEATALKAATTSDAAHRSAGETVRAARKHNDLAAAYLARIEKSAAHAELAAKAKDLAAIQAAIAADRESLAKLPSITPEQLDSLRELGTRIDKAESALNAIAAGIELITADQTVLLDGQLLETGTPRVITEVAEISLGGGTLLRIQPGGGTSLAQSRRTLDELRNQYATALDQLAIAGISEAAEILAQRQAIGQSVANRESQLDAIGGRDLPGKLASAKVALDAANAEVERRLAAFPEGTAPQIRDTAEDTRVWLTATGEVLQQAENTERSLLAEADAQRRDHNQKLQKLQKHTDSLEEGRRSLAEFENSARTLEQNHGDAATRAAALEQAKSAETTTRAAVQATTESLTALNPELLGQQVARLARVIAIEEQKQHDARTAIAVARTTLALDGSSDPEADLLQAKARHASALETRDREQRHADSIALLHRLFSESQASISAGVTQPIADRVVGYLECLYGRGVRVSVDWTEPSKASIKLTRPGTPAFSFDSLSGGAKEQVAAAVRLATAEILAASHGGTLPIVFDDAFAYADDNRIQSLQCMLDLAANRGLQVLVLTCTPADYIGLGARETILTPHQWGLAPSFSPSPAEEQTDDTSPPSAPAAITPPSGDLEALFLEALRSLDGKSGNQALRSALGWDEATYDQVKNSLISRNLIALGKGRGGSVSLV